MRQEFTVIIEKDPESGWLVGSVAELPGCYTQAQTMSMLEENMQEAIRVYLDTVQDEDLTPYPTFIGLQRLEVSL